MKVFVFVFVLEMFPLIDTIYSSLPSLLEADIFGKKCRKFDDIEYGQGDRSLLLGNNVGRWLAGWVRMEIGLALSHIRCCTAVHSTPP